jgi:hypothetical protein
MKLRSFLLNLTVGISALLFGLVWVGVYQFFLGNNLDSESYSVIVQNPVQPPFDINDPESVLPIDFEEEKLTSPKVDETNEAMFDPEGYYFFDGSPKGFENFFYVVINNKDFEASPDDKDFGKLMPPRGYVILESKTDVEYIDFETIKIADGKLQFETMTHKGISYEFNGEYLVKGNFYTLDENARVLHGTLIKKKDGQPVATKDFNFNWTNEITCLH